MVAYLVADIEVHDPTAFDLYRVAVKPIVESFGGRYLTRGGEVRALEGAPMRRAVLIEFPSMADAVRFYDSAEYKPVLQMRLDCTTSRVTLVDGI